MDQSTDQSSHPQAALHSRVPESTEMSPDKDISPLLSEFEWSSEELISKAINNKSHASASLASDRNHEDRTSVFPFLKLPAELRVQIYRYLLLARHDIYVTKTRFWPNTKEERQRYFIDIRFLETKMTYHITPNGLDPAILPVNRQIYLEASKVLYSENCFNLCNDGEIHRYYTSEVILPFLEDLSEVSRGLIKQFKFDYISLRYLVGPSAFSNPVFEETCDYLCQNLRLAHVTMSCYGMSIDGSLGGTDEEDQNTLDQEYWIQQLVPLVKTLETFELVDLFDEDEDLTKAVQTYLEFKMLKARKTMRQDQVGQEPADGSAAPDEQHRLEV